MTYTWTYQLDSERGITGWIAGANPDGEQSHTRPPPSPLADHGVPRWRLTPDGKVEPSGRAPTPEDIAAHDAKESEQRERVVIRENLVDLVARAAKGEDVKAEVQRLLDGKR
jgi:hypothetical protein